MSSDRKLVAPSPNVLIALTAMLASQVLVSLSSLVLPVLAPLIAIAVGVPEYLVGLYVSLMYGLAALSSLASGGFVSRFGPMRTNQACLVLVGVALWLTAVGSIPALALAAVIIGLGYGPTTPASSHILAKVTPRAQMNLVFSAKQTGVPLGNALAGALVPGLALVLGWRIAALALGTLCLALAFALQPWRRSFDADRLPKATVLSGARFAAPLRQVIGSGPIRQLALASIAYAGMQVCLGAFLITYLNREIGLGLVAAGFALSVAQVAGVGGRILWGLVADYLLSPRLVLGGLGIAITAAALATSGISRAWPYAMIVLVCAIFGGTAVAWNGIYFAQIARFAPAGKVGEVTGGSTFFTYGGVLIAPSLFSGIVAMTGSFSLAFAVLSLVPLFAGLDFLRPRA